MSFVGEFSYSPSGGELTLPAAQEQLLMRQLRSAVATGDKESMTAFGSLMTEPISTIADYDEWSSKVFTNKQVGPGEDWIIPVEQYHVMAYSSSPDGRTRRTRSGYTFTRPTWSSIATGFSISWDDMENAGWNIMGRNVMRTGQELARLRDKLALSVLISAAASVGHVVNTTGGLLTRASVDYIQKSAALVGFPVKRVVANHGTLQDMRQATFFTWQQANQMPIALASPGMADEVFRNGFIGDYGGANFFGTYGLSGGPIGSTLALTGGTNSLVLYLADPAFVGFKVQKGSVRQYSDINIDLGTNRYRYLETLFYYVANPYACWVQIVTG